MLKKRAQWKYLRKTCKRSLAHLDGFATEKDEEDLHKFRLDLKKIYAFIQFYKACGRDGISSKNVRTIKKISKQAGRIRDANNYLKLAMEHSLDETVFQQEQILYSNDQSERFVSNADHLRRKIKQNLQSLKTWIHPIKARCIRAWYAKQLREIENGLFSRNPEELHMSRKRIKLLLYVNELLPEPQADRLHLDTEYLDKLQKDIGSWHDVESFCQLAGEIRLSGTTIRKLNELTSEREKVIRAAGPDFCRNALASQQIGKACCRLINV